MARKSRKETAAVAVQEADAACRAAIYVRLSVEDTHTHSVSIETQQMIIARYLEQYPEISVYDTYIPRNCPHCGQLCLCRGAHDPGSFSCSSFPRGPRPEALPEIGSNPP